MPTNLDGDGGSFKPPPARPRYSSNVVQLRPKLDDRIQSTRAFDNLTAALIMERHRCGELDPAVLVALLAAVGLKAP
jgi:hypothetical protein